MHELALFAGAGGGILGGKLLGWETVCAVEIDPYCREVLLRRQQDGVLPVFPIWDDVRTFDGRPWRGLVDVVSGGFPCQPFSVAGKRLADADERNLWPETARVLGEVRRRWALLENVPGLVSNDYFGTIVSDLAALGFDCAWGVVGADDVGAPHRRKRLWIVCQNVDDPAGAGREAQRARGVGSGPRPAGGGSKEVAHATHDGQSRGGGARAGRDGSADGGDVADADEPGSQGRDCEVPRERAGERSAWASRSPWERDPADDPQSGLGRVAHGVAHRVHRLRALGNAQVPLCAATAFQILAQVLGEDQ